MADDLEQSVLLRRAFARTLAHVRVALTAPEPGCFLQQPAPHIVVLATRRWTATTTATLHELKQDSGAQLIIVVTTRPGVPTEVEVLRRQRDEFMRTMSIALPPGNWPVGLRSWLTGACTMLCLELGLAPLSGGNTF